MESVLIPRVWMKAARARSLALLGCLMVEAREEWWCTVCCNIVLLKNDNEGFEHECIKRGL